MLRKAQCRQQQVEADKARDMLARYPPPSPSTPRKLAEGGSRGDSWEVDGKWSARSWSRLHKGGTVDPVVRCIPGFLWWSSSSKLQRTASLLWIGQCYRGVWRQRKTAPTHPLPRSSSNSDAVMATFINCVAMALEKKRYTKLLLLHVNRVNLNAM